jgi:hypothetical protein
VTKEGVDDWDKVPSFDAGEAPRRSISSLGAKMPTDDDTDYRTYTRAELEEALGNIDADRYPTNYAHLRKELDARVHGTSLEPQPVDNSQGDTAIGFWVEVTIAGMVVLYTFIGALRGDRLVPRLTGRTPMHLSGVAAWIATAAVLVAATAVALGGLDSSDPPKIRPKFRWAFRHAGVVLVLAFCWHLIFPTP